ncbi:MAG: hypothetical protein ABS87_06595 [Sphingomonas sp. SCN 67-18]|uniref:phage holin family protein n=1 Tax=uncultured Sphingomonas sp. TaxID=158754 RepID=UPI00086D9901|nr:phage holin family protein [Sphingomonas sp. SCN 67-18]ODU21492.1 MAG: hypothetical protein ABS87_06595 [Sphingomonas sp. SCN 67-18]
MAEEQLPGKDDVSIADLLVRLVDETDDFVRAELGLFRAQALRRLTRSRGALAMALIGIVIVQASVIALLVGLIFALAPHVGPLAATLIVLAVALGIAGMLIATAWRQIREAFLPEEPDA